MVRSAVAGFQQTSVTLEEAAQNLGSPPLRTLARITIPLITANLVAGALLAFSFAMLEVSDSLILAQKQQDYPITKAIYELYQLLGEDASSPARLVFGQCASWERQSLERISCWAKSLVPLSRVATLNRAHSRL